MIDNLYPYLLIIHLACAIIFLGFIFTDVVLLSAVKKALGEEIAKKVFHAITSRGVKIMPLCLILLILTGGAMISRYIGVEKGFFDTHLQQFLMIKVFCALGIVVMVILSISSRFIIKKPNPFDKYTHPLALIFGACIVFCAKFAFM